MMRAFYRKNYFLIKRLHSLLGIIPVGAFFLVHMLLNSRAMQGPEQYQWVPNTLDQVPFLIVIELGFILLPILFHAALGAVIVVQGDLGMPRPALGWYAAWAYWLQRITGILLFLLIGFHIWQTWWAHTSLKLQGRGEEFRIFEFMSGIVKSPAWLLVYALFVLIAAYHFGNGIYNFTYKWGLTTNKRAQKWAIALGLLVGMVGVVLGFASLYGLSAGSGGLLSGCCALFQQSR
jgi:succinate dehydrogenase / fumarate reductase, cytochrome b subunit